MGELKSLIVRRRVLDEETLTAQVKEIASAFKLDPYQVRLSLSGYGLALLARGEPPALRQAGDLLSRLGYRWCVTDPPPSRLPINQIKHFEVSANRISFTGHSGAAELPRGAQVIAVLAEMRGQLLEKIMRQATYRADKAVPISEEDKYHEVLISRPVLDFYIVPPAKDNAAWPAAGALRFIQGRFDPAGLGDAATTSSTQNFDRIIQLVRRYAGRFELELDFGLFQMPDCRLEPSHSEEIDEANLRSLAHYGWYLLQLHRHGQGGTAPQTKSAAEAAAAVAGAPALRDHPELAVLAAGVTAEVMSAQARATSKPSGLNEPIDDTMLPPPPDVLLNARTRRFSRQFVQSAIMAGVWLLSVFSTVALDIKYRHSFWSLLLNKGVFMFLLAAGLFWGCFYYLRLKRWIEQTPTSKTRSLAMGLVEIKGIGERIYNLLSPISLAPCVYYRLRKYRRKNDGGNSQWVLTADIDSGPIDFYVRDETGRVRVDPWGAKIKANCTETFVAGMHAGLGRMLEIPDNAKYVEETVQEGAPIYVLGFASSPPKDTVTLHWRVTEKLRQLKQDRAKLMRFDANGDGQIDQQEWETARAEMELAAEREALRDPAVSGAADAVIGRPPAPLPFVISDASEKALTAKYLYLSLGLFAGAVLAAMAGTLLLLGVFTVPRPL